MIKPLIHSMIVCPDMDHDYPVISHGEGVYLYDEHGKKYLDGSSGSAAVSNLGHGITELVDAMTQQASKITVTPTHAFNSRQTETYLQKLVDFAPEGMVKAWTVQSGTEAVENALKLALQYHQLCGDDKRYKIIARWQSYHGNSVFTLDVGGMKGRRQSYSQWMNDFPHIPAAYSYRRPAGMTEEEYAVENAAELERCLLETGPETVAAFIVEPVVAAALGAVPPPKGYFQEIRRVCDKYGILFIADEILTGFGRLGTNFGIERFGVTPDIIAAGKGISGGYYPLSAVIANQKVMDVFMENKAPFLGGHTFSCNPVGAALGSAVIDYMQANKTCENASKMGEVLMEKLQRLYKYDIVGDIRGMGLLCGVELVADKVTKEPFAPEMNISKLIGQKSVEKGVVLYPGKGSKDGKNGDHIMITPPLTVNEEDLELLVSTLDTCISEVMAEISVEVNS
jgi:adenosylmethionine-8-amino-7-oxononanoate aminotransferase